MELQAHADLPGLNDFLSATDWSSVFSSSDPSAALTLLENTVLSSMELFVPRMSVTHRTKNKPWYNAYLCRLNRLRNRLFNRSKSLDREHRLSVAYRKIRNLYVAELRLTERRYYKNKASTLSSKSLQNDAHRWWKSAKAVCGIQTTDTIPPLVHCGSLKVSAAEKAAQCSAASSTPDFPATTSIVKEKFSFTPILPSSVYKRISTLNVWKAPGLDGISNLVLKNCAGALAEPLAHIFNSSLTSRVFPCQWKRGVIKPLYKHKGDRSNPSFYRPIVLLPCISKVFEGFVREQLQAHCLRNHAIPDNQFGFLPQRSAVWQLLSVMDDWCRILDSGGSVHACFLDLAKAFDRVDHSLLLRKLSSVGVEEEDLAWFTSYLCDRFVCTEVDGHKSSFQGISSGVPQGSVLGPLLFIIFYRDLPSVVSSSCVMFADDTLVFDRCCGDFDSRSCCRLQQDLVKLNTWAEDWCSNFNAAKSVDMVIGKRHSRASFSCKPHLVLGDSVIPRLHRTTHLGVLMTDRLSWSDHVAQLQKKLAFKVFTLKRLARRPGSADIVKRLYLSLVRTSLEYAAPVWDHCPVRDAMALERIQLAVARAVLKFCRRDHSNVETLKAIGWPSLAWRRRRFKLLLLWDLLHEGGPPALRDQVPPLVSSRTPYPLRNSSSISLPLCQSSRHLNSFLPSSIALFNSLPLSVSSCSSRCSFLLALDCHFISDKFSFGLT